jgi:hypothetical protein
MCDFSKRIAGPNGIILFSFTRIYTVRGLIYFVAAAGRSVRHNFHMEKVNGTWRLIRVPKSPDWLAQLEGELVKAISENQLV